MQLAPYAYFPLLQEVHVEELVQVRQSEFNVEQTSQLALTKYNYYLYRKLH